jgi:hypothetical protein
MSLNCMPLVVNDRKTERMADAEVELVALTNQHLWVMHPVGASSSCISERSRLTKTVRRGLYLRNVEQSADGFYSPAVLVKDAQRHGLRVKPIDAQVSDWACTIEHERNGSLSLRVGLGYAKGLREQSAEGLVFSRVEGGLFRSAEDLALRVPLLNRKN